MKTLLVSLLVAALFNATSIYDFKVPGLDGNIDFAAFKGKKILIVNTASQCGNTPQYKDLETLYEQHKGELVIVGFPANNFGGQEPGSNNEIKEFCSSKYAISFPMAEKISVKGDDTHPLYKFLKEQAAAKGLQDPVTWNFGKFLLNESGELVATFSPKTKPDSPEIQKWFN
ncbi:MAG TPA: glutathione peroxidase [Chitinophagaceae bacterium]|nr:glutathione peroxidase [Chitinophagales bacterium]HPG12606.1 glutathione peroxidase [Chitinophagaceae bacterium]HRX95156.1 glutathione peroxidase [Chitinophagaceae bacterium]